MDSAAPLECVAFFLLLIGFTVVVGLHNQRTKAQLRKYGVTTTARVVSRKYERHSVPELVAENISMRSSTTESYWITFQYVVNGKSYMGRRSVDFSVYSALVEGQAVEVVYLPEHPGQARLASSL